MNSGLLNGLVAAAPRTGRAVLTRRQVLSTARKSQARTNIGAGTSSFDPTTYAGALTAGAVTASGTLTASNTVVGSKQAVSGNGAVTAPNLTTLTTIYTGTSGANLTATLPSGSVDGQIKIITCYTLEVAQLLTITANMADGNTSIQFAYGNSSVMLQWDSADIVWIALNYTSAVTIL